MPIYQYRCETCRERFEVQAKIADVAPQTAPGCTQSCVLVKELAPVAGFIHGKTTLSAAKGHVEKATEILAKGQAPQPSSCAKPCSWHD